MLVLEIFAFSRTADKQFGKIIKRLVGTQLGINMVPQQNSLGAEFTWFPQANWFSCYETPASATLKYASDALIVQHLKSLLAKRKSYTLED